MNGNSALSLAVDTVSAVTERNGSRAPSAAPRPQRVVAFPSSRYPALTLAIEVLLIVTLSYGPLLVTISL
jgi:hypothetical protein